MSAAIQFGPLLLPLSLLLVIASGGSTLALGKWLSRSSAEVDNALWLSLLAGVVLARLAFVFEYRSLYLAAPLTILDIRDGGWSAPFGLLGAWMYVLYRERKAPAIKGPLRWALALGTAIFFVGTTVLSFKGASGQSLPELTFTSIDGKTLQLSEFKGKPTVVNLWATWCPPCVREMPVLHAAQDQRTDVNFVFLNQGEEGTTVSSWLDGQRLSLRNVLLDPQRKASAAFQQQGYPTTLFFNAKGELVEPHWGAVGRHVERKARNPLALSLRASALSNQRLRAAERIEMNYGFHATIKGPFDAAVQRVMDSLKTEGFGVLSDIDIQKAMKEKLGNDMAPHRILGACNPALAYKALQAEADIGLLLPCNVTVRQGEGDDIIVGFLNPDLMVNLTENPALREVSEDASARLRRVRDALQG